MSRMGTHPADDVMAPQKPRDHLWVLAVIAAFALFDVWGAWAQVGDKSGFAVGKTGTGWTLTVIVEAAAGYFLFAWFNAPGQRSRRFAMCSAFAALALSLIGQGASSFAAKAQPPAWLAVFVKDLPVVVLALIAVLIHMRRLDREDAEAAAQSAAEAQRQAGLEAAAGDERTALRAELEAVRQALEAAGAAHREELATVRADRESVQCEAETAAAEAVTLRRKLEAATGRKRRTATGRKRTPATGRKQEPVTAPVTGAETEPEAPDDLDSEAKVLWYLENGFSASRAGVKAGLTDSRGRQIARLKKTAPADAVDGMTPAGSDAGSEERS